MGRMPDGHIDVRHGMPEQVLDTTELVMRLAADRELHLETLRRHRRDDWTRHDWRRRLPTRFGRDRLHASSRSRSVSEANDGKDFMSVYTIVFFRTLRSAQRRARASA